MKKNEPSLQKFGHSNERFRPEAEIGINKHLRVARREVASSKGPVHWHNYFEIEIVLNGRARHYLNGDEYEINRGEAHILTPVDYHGIITLDDKMTIWHVAFDESMLSDKQLYEMLSPDTKKTLRLPEKELERISTLASLLMDECEQKENNCVKEMFDCFLCVLLRQATTHSTTANYVDSMTRALSYLEIHFRENPSLKEVAETAGFHPNYFSELFKKMTGTSYITRLNQLRVSYAQNLLARGASVASACFDSGFGSLSNFQHVFTAQCGLPPSEYRKRYYTPNK